MSFKARATRVLPTYRDLLSDYLGMSQIILGFVVLIFSIIAFAVRAFTSAATTGVLAAITLVLCGTFGIMAGIKKELWAVSMYFFQASVTGVFCVVLFAASIVAISYEELRLANTSVTLREAIDICLLCLGMLCGVTCVLALLLTGLTLFTDTCKCVRGAKYVEEPNVEYHGEDNMATCYPETSDGHTDLNQSTKNSVPEINQDGIRCFENPTTNSANENGGVFPV